MSTAARVPQKEKQDRSRQRLRRKGLRRVHIWVPDTRAEGFATECRRQARLAARSAEEKPTLDFISEIADWDNA
ncbi:MAG: antitoxin MazE family protein [Nitrospira sp.]